MKDFGLFNWYNYSSIKESSINNIINHSNETENNFIFKDYFITNNKINLWELELYDGITFS